MPTPNTEDYSFYLLRAFNLAEALVDAENFDKAILNYQVVHSCLWHILKTEENGLEVSLGQTVFDGIQTIIGNLNQNKYIYSILITALVEKLVHPNQDIRYAQREMPGGYSNRSTDQIHVTPFFKNYNLTACAASGAESGRYLERPFPHTLNYICWLRGKGNREAFLGILHAVQVEGVDPFPCIVMLMALDLKNTKRNIYKYSQPQGLTIQQIFDAVLKHHQLASGNGRARLPVLAIQAIYQCLVAELSRYKDKFLRNPPNRHTANDKKGWIGDIQVDHSDRTPFEGVEVKSGRSITREMISVLPKKFRGYAIDRYYILSTAEPYVAKDETGRISTMVKQVYQTTGCQVIVNGLNHSLWYYLRLVSEPEKFLENYTDQLKTDLDVKNEHRKLWADILERLDN